MPGELVNAERAGIWLGRVRDDCITVAVDEMPDEGLDQPLRLDKLANEVWRPPVTHAMIIEDNKSAVQPQKACGRCLRRAWVQVAG